MHRYVLADLVGDIVDEVLGSDKVESNQLNHVLLLQSCDQVIAGADFREYAPCASGLILLNQV